MQLPRTTCLAQDVCAASSQGGRRGRGGQGCIECVPMAPSGRRNGNNHFPTIRDEQGSDTDRVSSSSVSGETLGSWYMVLPKIRGRGHHGTGRSGRGQGTRRLPQCIGPGTGRPNGTEDPLAVRFAPNIWNKDRHKYANEPLDFMGPELDCTHPYGRLPSMLGLFEKF
jgi:hypothetical protein